MESRLDWVLAACGRVMRPVVRLALGMGLKYPHLEELMRDLFIDEARRLSTADGSRTLNVSQLSASTGLNRKVITAKVRGTIDTLPNTEVSAAAKTFTLWLQIFAEDAACRRLPIVAEDSDDARSFEKLARLGSRGNLHHRAILDELVRLDMVREEDGWVEIQADAFVPAKDLQAMLAFLADNSRDHLLAAVSNVQGGRPPMLERAVYARGMKIEDCEKIDLLVRKRWNVLHHELTREMTRAVDAATSSGEGAGKDATARIRVGIYTYFEDISDPQGGGRSKS